LEPIKIATGGGSSGWACLASTRPWVQTLVQWEKKKKEKRAGGVAQTVEYLPSKPASVRPQV
jgi:hypothetical protein